MLAQIKVRWVMINIIGQLVNMPEEQCNGAIFGLLEQSNDYFDVLVEGRLAKCCIQYLSKDINVKISGTLRDGKFLADSVYIL